MKLFQGELRFSKLHKLQPPVQTRNKLEGVLCGIWSLVKVFLCTGRDNVVRAELHIKILLNMPYKQENQTKKQSRFEPNKCEWMKKGYLSPLLFPMK